MSKRGKRINRSRAGDITMFLILFFFGAFMATPLIYAIGNSFKPLEEIWTWPPTLIPIHPTLENYTNLSSLLVTSWVPFSRYFFNTVMITIVGTFGHIILSSLAAYPLSLYKFPGSKSLLSMVRLALMFGTAVTTIPSYIIMSRLGMIDTYWALILPALGTALGLYLMTSFMGQIPYSIIEAARIDGAGHLRVFWKIVMPQVKSAWLTLIIFSVNTLWNLGSSDLIYSEQLKTLGVALGQISGGGLGRSGVAAAISVVMMSVPIVIFVITQSNIIETMATSGMKD